MKMFGKNISPRQLILSASGLLVMAATTYDIHRSIKNNDRPPSKEQVEALEEYLRSIRQP